MSYQQTFDIRTRGRGTTQITHEVARLARASGVATGIAPTLLERLLVPGLQ